MEDERRVMENNDETEVDEVRKAAKRRRIRLLGFVVAFLAYAMIGGVKKLWGLLAPTEYKAARRINRKWGCGDRSRQCGRL